MIWDPIYIDWDGVKQLAFYLVCGAFIISFGASTSGRWFALFPSNPSNSRFIAGSMVLLLAEYFYERFKRASKMKDMSNNTR